MDRERLDAHDRMPDDIRAYLEKNGWSFSKKMCEFAVGRMKDRNGKKLEPLTKEQVDKLLKTYEIVLKHDNGYDCVYGRQHGEVRLLGDRRSETSSSSHDS